MSMKQLEIEIVNHLKEAPIVKAHLQTLDWKMNWVMGLISATFVATLGALLALMIRR
jgi:hypothetical protein